MNSKTTRFCFQTCLLLIASMHLSSTNGTASDWNVFEWQAVPGTAYYRGRYEVNGKETMFQTSNTSLRLPASATVTIKAISSEQRLLQTITPDSKPAAPNAEKAMVTLSEPAPTEAPAPTEMPRKEEAEAEAEAEAEEVPAESPVELYNFHSNINIGLGFGKETLDLQGDAALNNTANITGTRVAGQLSWNRLTHGWHFNLSGFVHKFIAETVVLADGSKLSEQKFNRMRFDVTATYERMVSDFGIGLGVGFASISGPIITVDRPADKEGFSTTRSTIPQVHLTLGRTLPSSIEINLSAMTSIAAKDGDEAQNFGISAIKVLPSNILLGAGVDSRSESIGKGITCPSPFDCRSRTEMTTKLTYGYLSVGYRF